MPNYHYRCCKCKQVTELALPISTDPKKLMACECGYSMKRIIRAFGAASVKKTYAGDWFKKTYGYDMADHPTSKAKLKEDMKKAEQKHNEI